MNLEKMEREIADQRLKVCNADLAVVAAVDISKEEVDAQDDEMKMAANNKATKDTVNPLITHSVKKGGKRSRMLMDLQLF